MTRHEHVAITCRLFQQMQNTGPNSLRIIRKRALLLRNPVRDIKSHSRKITGDLVRMILENIDGRHAILFKNTAAVSQ